MSSTNTNAGYGFGHGGATHAADDVSPLYPHHSLTVANSLIATAQALVYPKGKGIYATDETPDGMHARLVAAAGESGDGKELTEEEKRDRRKNWRLCLYETLPTEYISGVILYHETLHDFQLASVLSKRGIIPGVRADTDSHPLPISPLEPATQGLDDLLPRLQKAYKDGARFSKWRAPFLVDAKSYPSQAAVEAQAESLARFAAISQQAGLVPIVEPDLDYSGDADMKRSVDMHVKCISAIYTRCFAYGVLIEGTLIKPSFPQPGKLHPSHSNVTSEEVAIATATVLARAVPVSVAGVVFLSGGLPDVTATNYLHAVNKLVNSSPPTSPFSRLPPLTFSFGRGLQGDAMVKWVTGDSKGAKEAFEKRAKVCSAAAKGA